MAIVDLVYASDCPNVSLARANLLLAFARAGVKPKWSEHRIGDPEAPEHTRGYGGRGLLSDLCKSTSSGLDVCRVAA